MDLKWFRVPKDIVFGEGTLKYLSAIEGKKAVLVTGGNSMKRFGFLNQAREELEKAGMEVMIIDGVEPNPSVNTVVDGGRKMAEFNPDWIIAIGGGSALDAAKIMWVYYENPETKFEDLVAGKFPTLRKKAKFIAIPSTSGTASEITAFSVITDTVNKIKYPLVSYEITPDIAILDPVIPSKTPAHITANTGMDVMTHAIESYTSTAATCYTKPLSMESIKMVFESLTSAYSDGDDIKAREDMHNASTLSGMAFTSASLGIVHSMAHKIGGELGITHGLANAVLLPYVIEYNRKSTDGFDEIEKTLGVDDIVTTVKELNQRVGIPLSLKEIDEVEVSEENFKNVLERMSINAFNDPCTLTNPRNTSAEDIKEIFLAAYYGTTAKNI
ncbi:MULTISPECIES: iron-containing alcohol dehydrogenase [Psychrilyobacter]|uniref:Iron-containing alcohol dehydrogenase n=1 Tax=Psychrilyobacter piezotolerans TaxID=2293438 RepID=A0ABX9KIX6_9FUSO|nr:MULTISPECIES: iron-containing alcohol dehydrogenase [Psychrilyobacter]MCS5422758.1 iron-containing alcohol dehydrogenase [Psychrilyobacter sp. S5]NDI77132.1 iron-containing alcohol dehydrogenase [Psychrilyobacter piezotolerans]RDE64127.1 iron-containing alcohol dehydrogenase [Psychrilyobacter sp. S5]REI42219.1 iron-containing alcohol dehydrogenase [Psychrilyobacter piezotolerans]